MEVNNAGSSSAASFSTASPTMTEFSPEALIAFCQFRLGDLDKQITDGMNWQKTQVADRKAINDLQTTLGSFAPKGPPDEASFKTCVDAFNTAINSMDSSDPNRVTLQKQLATMQTAYVQPASTLSVDDGNGNIVKSDVPEHFKGVADGQWKATTDPLGGVLDDIKSGAEVQLLKLQDLIAERQRAVETATGMMTKTDQTLEDQARAIGQ